VNCNPGEMTQYTPTQDYSTDYCNYSYKEYNLVGQIILGIDIRISIKIFISWCYT